MLLCESIMATAQIFATDAFKKHEIGLRRIWSTAAGNGVGSDSSSGGGGGGGGGKTAHLSGRYSLEKDVFK
jgi:uncharacterized membrane protein